MDYNRGCPATRQGISEPSPVGEGGPPQRWMRCHPIYTVLGIFKLKFEYHLTHKFLFIELFGVIERSKIIGVHNLFTRSKTVRYGTFPLDFLSEICYNIVEQ